MQTFSSSQESVSWCGYFSSRLQAALCSTKRTNRGLTPALCFRWTISRSRTAGRMQQQQHVPRLLPCLWRTVWCPTAGEKSASAVRDTLGATGERWWWQRVWKFEKHFTLVWIDVIESRIHNINPKMEVQVGIFRLVLLMCSVSAENMEQNIFIFSLSDVGPACVSLL